MTSDPRWRKTEMPSPDAVDIEEHFAQLAEIAKLVLDRDVGKVVNAPPHGEEKTYTIIGGTSGSFEITHNDLVAKIEGNIDIICTEYGPWHFWDKFMPHLVADCPECHDLHDYLNSNPLGLINALQILAERKRFRGTCPVCEGYRAYSPDF